MRDWRRMEKLRKERENIHGHFNGKPRTGKPRKVKPPKRLTDDDFIVLSYLLQFRNGIDKYATDIAENVGLPVESVDNALLRLLALGVVGYRVHCGGYRPFTWCGKPGRRGLGASPEVKAALAEWMEQRKIGGQGSGDPVNTG